LFSLAAVANYCNFSCLNQKNVFPYSFIEAQHRSRWVKNQAIKKLTSVLESLGRNVLVFSTVRGCQHSLVHFPLLIFKTNKGRLPVLTYSVTSIF
jgi:hypothetical protein